MRHKIRSLYLLSHDSLKNCLSKRSSFTLLSGHRILPAVSMNGFIPFNIRCMTSSLPPNPPESSSSTPTSNKKDSEVNNDHSIECNGEHSSTLLPFPWRVHATEPLPRVVNQDDFSGMEITPWARFVRKAYVALELNTSWIDIIFGKRWENELVQSCAFAFQRAVSGLLSRSFQVPIRNICQFDDPNCKTLSINTNTITTPNSTHIQMTDEDRKYTEQYLEGILDSKLLQVYHSISSNVHIDFSLTLVQVRLENAFMIPHLTRSDVYTDSSLQGAYTAIEKKWRETRDTEAIIEMGRHLQTKTKHGGGKRSLLVDVSVICLEKFQLRDRESGKILAGHETAEEQIVTHLVRFEMETEKSRGGNSEGNHRELGLWKIVDIDDLLQGNIWY